MRKFFAIRTKINLKIFNALAAGVFLLILILWMVLSEQGSISPIFLPTPRSVFGYLANVMTTGQIWSDIGISFYRIFMGFILAAVIGIPLGILAGTFNFAEALIQPVSEFIRYMPVPAFVPLIMVWVGINESAKIAVIFLGTLFQLIPMVADSVRAVPDDLLSAAYTLGAKPRTVILKVIIPAIAPRTMDTLRIMMGWAWTYLVVAELVAANSGLGYSILKAQRFLKTDAIFGGILIIGFLGLMTDRLFVLANRKLFPWAEGGS
ncbi:binding-protein-dependent transport systems inner membrane component [Syntrophobotulus glycolicus DSM 8271]|uniref:Binding-protein-dependent transport systems inner membrane component n=1 Tax=Syntrophobotulus glycolicus (strain DSM 8271 / FlGlyR) TaxID=645991 RepID=F0T192_SYNGF|nr:ABC transporter permease [Syntrophobotulus glycolicus]ADY55156.1 binding-protein-dependent transport systems inner membrane component [Syntrophobotulus glycolicus DSM 8271]